jgi:outer membrane protein OmpA-like peptidoglycan-associated protein
MGKERLPMMPLSASRRVSLPPLRRGPGGSRVRAMRLGLCVTALLAGISGNAAAQDFMNQEWLLDPALSSVYMQTVKANSIFETHQFTVLDGGVSSSGNASIRMDLASIHSGHDLRDTRMRFQLFETFKFRYAQINARLDKAKLQALATQTRLSYPLAFSLSMHGHASEVRTEVWITRVTDTTVSVASIKPINLLAETFGLLPNIARLVDAIEGTPIAGGASVAFDLVFKTGALKPALESTLARQQKQAAEEEARPLTAEACEVRFTVVSQTGAIQFRSGSSLLDPASEAILNSIADIANRCGTIAFDINGHTDNVGDARANLQLSLDRAKAVTAYLQGRGVSAARMHTKGFGGERPVKSNDIEAGRAANRRIEFELKR